VTTPDHSRRDDEGEDSPQTSSPRVIPAAAILHQEGVIAVIAVVALWFREGGLAKALDASVPMASAIGLGAAVGLAGFGLLWLVRAVGPLRDLEAWQGKMVAGWSSADVAAVAVFSGLAEEALVRALLQPILGLVPAALLFALLHIVPDRKLWFWPILAFGFGLVLGVVFEYAGYPAAAAAHIVINALSLSRLRGSAEAG
jgi:membrane protease YdiL (CAAX protease family)